jgi:hypothetical protein
MQLKPTPEEKFECMRQQLAAIYKELSDQYKRMMKVSDEWRLTGLQEGADWRLQDALMLRKKMVRSGGRCVGCE